MNYLLFFLAGFFLFNSIPHLVKGITGQTHMTPFKRVSSPYLNIIWAASNIIFALLIIGYINQHTLALNWPWQIGFNSLSILLFLLGGFIISMMDAQLFSNPNARLPWHTD